MSRLNKLPVCAGLAFLLSPHSNNHSLTGFIEFEIDRLRAAGHPDPEKLAVWTSRSDPGADHDILSVAADGKPLWIEVKSTTGTDGRFDWPRAEFEKALREGDHFELWRVYEAHTESPTVKVFRDPASLLRTSALRLELATLRAFVEGKG